MGWISVLYLVNVILALWVSGLYYFCLFLFLFKLQIPINQSITLIRQWSIESWRLQGGYLVVPRALPATQWSQWVSRTEPSREGASVRACIARMWAWANGCERVRVHAWVDTAGRQQLWQASAVERHECCHSQVTPNHSQTDLLSSHFLSRSSPTGAACCWAWLGMKTHECAMTSWLLLPQSTREECVHRFYDSCLCLSLNARQTSPLCLISTITER